MNDLKDALHGYNFSVMSYIMNNFRCYFHDTIISMSNMFVFMSITYSILAYAFGIPGRPVILQCGKSILKGPEPLDWSVYNKDRLLLARGFFVNSTLANASYYDRLGEGRAELSPNASLTIHSYENRDGGDYYCSSRSRYVTATLRPFRMYIL